MILIECYGNSLTAGIGGGGVAYSYPNRLDVLLGDGYHAFNWGNAGATTELLLTNYADTTNTFEVALGTTFERKILILMETVNSVSNAGHTAAKIIQDHKSISTLARSYGWEVLVCSASMRSDFQFVGINTTLDDAQNRIWEVNAYFRTSWSPDFDGFIDMARSSYNGDRTRFDAKFTTNPGPEPYIDPVHLYDYQPFANEAYAGVLDYLGLGGEEPSPIKTITGLSGGEIKTINGLSGGTLKYYTNGLWV